MTRTVGAHDPRRWMSCARRGHLTLAAVDEHVHESDELPRRDLADDHLVRRLQEVARLGMLACERAKDELRHRHVRGSFDAVPGDVAERDRKSPVAELHEVVDVAADLDPRRRLVRIAELEPLQLRDQSAAAASAASCPRTASAAGTGARCRSRAPPGRRSRSPGRSSRCVTGEPGCIDRIVSDASTSAGVAIGTSAPVHPRSRNGRSAVSGAPIASAVSRVIRNGSPYPKQQLDRMSSESLRACRGSSARPPRGAARRPSSPSAAATRAARRACG